MGKNLILGTVKYPVRTLLLAFLFCWGMANTNAQCVEINSSSISVTPSATTQFIFRDSAGNPRDPVSGSIVFTVAAAGATGSLTYEWYVNGRLQIGETNSAFIFTPASEGVYNVYAAVANECTQTNSARSEEIKVIVTRDEDACTPTVAISSSSSGVVCAGDNVTFTATPQHEGSAPVYEWRVNNGSIVGTSATYSYIPQNNDVVSVNLISNAACAGSQTTASDQVTVTVASALSTSHPSATTICSGTTNTFSVGAASGGTGSFSYQWQSSSDNSSWNNISGATSQNYTTPSLSSSTYYRRQATNNCGTINSNSALVTIASALSTPHPSGTTICSGSTYTLSVGAASGGSGSFSYQWQNSTNGSTWNNISGATSQNYTTPALTSNTYYRRQATNNCGTVTSNSALVTVASALSTPHPSSTTICSGATATFNLGVATGGTGTFTYQWQNSTNGSTWNNISGATSQTYYTPSLTSNMYYRRQATNSCGTVTSNSALVTIASAQSTPHPVAATISSGSTHTFTLGAATGGAGTYTYQWQNSTNGSSWSTISGATSQNYTTPALTSSTYYRRVATNNCGPVTSNSALVTVTSGSGSITLAAGTVILDGSTYPQAMQYIQGEGTSGTFTFEILTSQGGWRSTSFTCAWNASTLKLTTLNSATITYPGIESLVSIRVSANWTNIYGIGENPYVHGSVTNTSWRPDITSMVSATGRVFGGFTITCTNSPATSAIIHTITSSPAYVSGTP